MLYIGYRWYDLHNVKPAFEFGYGLSYTKFDYKNLVITNRNIQFTLTNMDRFKDVKLLNYTLDSHTQLQNHQNNLKDSRRCA